MAALRISGAQAPGARTPGNDEAPALAGAEGFRVQESDGRLDCGANLIATAKARAAQLGIEARPVGPDIWQLRHARGAEIGIVRGIAALEAAIRGFEAARDDVAALVQRMRGSA